MTYSVGPMLTKAGLAPGEIAQYTQIYADAMNEIANSQNKIDGFRITMLSSGVYRGQAPIAPFADTAAECIIDAVGTEVKDSPRWARFPEERKGIHECRESTRCRRPQHWIHDLGLVMRKG